MRSLQIFLFKNKIPERLETSKVRARISLFTTFTSTYDVVVSIGTSVETIVRRSGILKLSV